MKIFCVGRNYAAHVKELNNKLPSEPVIFMKPKNALLQHNEPFYYPDFTVDLQYECELVVQMCKNGKSIYKKYASRYYDKVGLGIDFTARDIQKKLKEAGHPWEKAKAFDDSAVLGKLLPVSEVGKMSEIRFSLLKNEEKVQTGDTSDMLFSVDELVAYISRFFTLNIGDLIYTGTPAGVGRVQIGDRLQGFLADEKMFDFEIR